MFIFHCSSEMNIVQKSPKAKLFCDTGREPFDERIFQALFKCMNNMCINAILSTHLFSMTAVRIAVRASIFRLN